MQITITLESTFNEGDTVIFTTGMNAPIETKILEVKLTADFKFLYRLECRPFVFFSADCLSAANIETV